MPSAETLARLRREAGDGPVVFLNLLAYRKPDGRETYARYSAIATPLLTAAGGRVIFAGKAGAVLAGPDIAWDDLVLVRYPSLAHFLELTQSDAYTTRAAPIRAEALAATLWMAVSPVGGFGEG